MNKTATLELLKELMRTGILAALAAMVTFLTSLEDPTLLALVLTPVLRAIDRAIHVSDKTKLNGLVPF